VTRARRRLVVASVATLALLGPLAWLWWSSLVPDPLSVMDMGYVDTGGGPPLDGTHRHEGGTRHQGHTRSAAGGTGAMGGNVSVADLTGPRTGRPDVSVDLVARAGTVELASGRRVDGYTLNGSSPGPEIRARVGDLVRVRVTNESVADGMTLHWHGVDVPNAEDGVAGVTQDAIGRGQEHTYRFVVPDAGTYWYHSHQVSHEQVVGGLLGPLVVLPRRGIAQDVDTVAVAHTYRGTRTLNGLEGDVTVAADPGQRVRVRIVNTDNASVRVWADTGYRVLAVDGYDVNRPDVVDGRSLAVTAGARADLEVAVPSSGEAVRMQVGRATAVVVGPAGAASPAVPDQPGETVDLLSYGEPAALPFDPTHPDRRFRYDIDRRPGFLDGRPGVWWTINGHLYPDVPMFAVEEGDVAVFRIHNDTGESHPMHLHGHHAVVLSRDGVDSSGSPWWVDSLDVLPGETYEIAFLADNPGVWMDHCHQLEHARDGMIAHLMYAGVTTPYLLGGPNDNTPE
jgi:FtsP/CotA-like multicopper oxidase with cupredoxin domain